MHPVNTEPIEFRTPNEALLPNEVENALRLGRARHVCDKLSAIIADDRHFITQRHAAKPSRCGLLHPAHRWK
jgi:hypothetical protein